jgi:hypothetical protein
VPRLLLSILGACIAIPLAGAAVALMQGNSPVGGVFFSSGPLLLWLSICLLMSIKSDDLSKRGAQLAIALVALSVLGGVLYGARNATTLAELEASQQLLGVSVGMIGFPFSLVVLVVLHLGLQALIGQTLAQLVYASAGPFALIAVEWGIHLASAFVSYGIFARIIRRPTRQSHDI